MRRWSPAGSPPTKQPHQQLMHLENVNPSQVCSIPVFWTLPQKALGIHPGQATRHTFSIRSHTGGGRMCRIAHGNEREPNPEPCYLATALQKLR